MAKDESPIQYVSGNVVPDGYQELPPWYAHTAWKWIIRIFSFLVHAGIIAIFIEELAKLVGGSASHLVIGLVAGCVILLAIADIAFLFWALSLKGTLRKYRVELSDQVRKRGHLDCRYHAFLHNLRNKWIETSQRLSVAHDEKELYSLKQDLAETAVKGVCDYFQMLIPDAEIGCALRLVRRKKEREEFVTTARCCLHENRSSNDSVIQADQGLPAHFRRQRDEQGVLIYRDLTRATQLGLYHKTRNDEKFPDDIRTFMVAPVNGEEEGEKRMLGLLYVTSRSDVFHDFHADPLRVFADALGMLFAHYRDKTMLHWAAQNPKIE